MPAQRHYCLSMARMVAALCVPFALALVLAACGGESAPSGADPEPSSADDGSAGAVIRVVRTGGISGFHDTVEVRPDGTARLTRRNGGGRTCVPSAEALDRLRSIDLKAASHAPSASRQIADGFVYTVTRAGVSTSVAEGEEDGTRAELVAAAGEVLSSCLTDQAGGAAY